MSQLKPRNIFNGRLGIWQTLYAMKELVHEASADSGFCRISRELVHSEITPLGKTEALDLYVRQNMKFENDPTTFEFLKSPLVTLKEIIGRGYATGDCDDHVVLLAAMLKCNGIANAGIGLALPSMGEGLNHVVNGIPLGDGGYKLLDTSVKSVRFGYVFDESLAVNF